MNSRFIRNEALIGKGGQEKLKAANVLVVGVGGVGGYVVEMLVRAGVGTVAVMDMDTIAATDLNRQIIALSSTLGRSKVPVIAERMKDINPDVRITAIEERFTSDNSSRILSEKFDYCVDAIDSVKDKTELIRSCKGRGIPCISALGAGNRLEARFEVKDIFSTCGDGLARVIRSSLRKLGIKEHKTVCPVSSPIVNDVPPASISYVPAAMGCLLAQEVIKDLLCR